MTATVTAVALTVMIMSTPTNAVTTAKKIVRVSQPKLYKVTNGKWGTTGAEMLVEKSAVKIKFDCAEGEIPLTLKKDRKGNFKVEGAYTRRGYGPIRIGKPPTAEPVTYEGKVTGKSMKIKITVIATGDLIGEFTLTRGQEGRIRGCR